jgi:uncharacterized membrane protein YdjX (TVP38/TMEM64 family)
MLLSSFLMILQSTIAPLPANVTIAANGLVFGPLWGAFVSWVSMLIGASLCFALSRKFGKPLAKRFAGTSLDAAEKFFERYGLTAMLGARMIPLIPFDAVSYVAGFVGVPYTRFIGATAVGLIPSVVIYSYIGSMGVTRFWWIVGILAATSAAGVWLGRRFLRRFWRDITAPEPATATLRRPVS